MQDYKRIVSYIHTYENNEKQKNVGFGKLEARGGLAKLQIQVNGLNTQDGRVFSIYLLNIDEYTRGIKLGECKILQGKISAEFKFGTENIMQSGFSISQIQGIYLTTEDAPYAVLASSWTDAAIEPEKFRTGESGQTEICSETAVVEFELQQGEDVIEELQATAEPETVQAAVISPVEEVSETGVEDMLVTFMESLEQFDSFENSEEFERIVKEELDFLEKTPWEELCSRYPKVIAFEGTDRPHRMCLKIDLKDLNLIAGAKREINENIYLIRSYYKHRYLLLIENEKDLKGKSCLLGIPGTYCKNEAHLAKMFKFEDFYPSKVSENANGSFGYWCKEILL
ncbi:MAG: hypothetical protein E7261_05935 [Lachnospiraceae bacterium]|nr:hypothetical protein [Lachnospiraceae bacterium]